MDWLIPAVVTSATLSFIVTLVYFHFYTVYRQSFTAIWALGWFFYCLRFVFEILSAVDHQPILQIAGLTCSLLNFFFLLWGTFVFMGKPLKKRWPFISAITEIYTVYAVVYGLPFYFQTLPVFFIMGAVYVYMGIIILKTPYEGAGRIISGWAFMLWGIHKIDFPFLREMEWFAPFGFYIGSLLAVLAAVGMMLMYTQKVTTDLIIKEKKLRLLADNARDMIYRYRLDPISSFEYISPASTSIIGYLPEQIYENPGLFFKTIHKEDRQILKAVLNQPEKCIEPLELRLTHRDGRVAWVEFHSVPVYSEGALVAVEGIARDITDRKKAGEVLKRYQIMFEHVRDIMLFVRNDGRIIDANDSAVEAYGYSRDDLISMSIHHLRKPGQNDLINEQMRQADLNGIIFETVHCRRDGSTFPVEVSSKGVTIGSDRVLLSIVRDITDRKRAEEDLHKAKEAAEAASRAKSEFMANMSHEIRTPMNSIIGMTELLIKTPLTHDQYELASTVQHSAGMLLSIVDDILDFSKTESGKLKLESIPFSPLEVIEKSVAAMEVKARKNNVPISVSIGTGFPSRLRGDPGRIRQVLINLINNALKFTEAGEITVRAAVEAEKNDLVLIRYEVLDTGIGISEEALDCIFDPFVQADGSSTRKYGGTGLGLTISKQLVKLMGGDIGVKSEPGRGSTFWFTIPLKKIVEDEEIIQNIPDIKVLPPKHFSPHNSVNNGESRVILLAEDNPVNRKLTLAQLHRLGYTAHTACNGREAVEMVLGGFPYALILMDCQMPEMDGFEATRAIREKKSIPGKYIPIIALTAHVMEGYREGCLEAGMDDYLCKPVYLEQLDIMLKRWVKTPEEFTKGCAIV